MPELVCSTVIGGHQSARATTTSSHADRERSPSPIGGRGPSSRPLEHLRYAHAESALHQSRQSAIVYIHSPPPSSFVSGSGGPEPLSTTPLRP